MLGRQLGVLGGGRVAIRGVAGHTNLAISGRTLGQVGLDSFGFGRLSMGTERQGASSNGADKGDRQFHVGCGVANDASVFEETRGLEEASSDQ